MTFIGPVSVFPQALDSSMLQYLQNTSSYVTLQSFAGILLVACCKKKRKQKTPSSHSNPMYACSEPKPTKETVTTSHANPTYEVSDYRPENQSEDNEYFIPDKIAPPEWSKSQSDLQEQWYDDIGNKDLTVRFPDDPIYDCLEPYQNGNHTLSFTNQSFLTSSDT